MSAKFSTVDAERYWSQVAGLRADQLVFVDETGFTQKAFYRRYGRSLKNQKCIMHTFGPSSRRVNIIAAVLLRGFLAVQMFQGACTRDVYNDFIITQLVSCIAVYRIPNYD